MNSVFDPGLQPERTALAWRRTGLALLVGSLVAARILPEVLGAWATILGLTGVIAAATLLAAIHLRYRTHHELLTRDGDRVPLAEGRLIFATAAFLFAAGLTTLALIVVLALNVP